MWLGLILQQGTPVQAALFSRDGPRDAHEESTFGQLRSLWSTGSGILHWTVLTFQVAMRLWMLRRILKLVPQSQWQKYDKLRNTGIPLLVAVVVGASVLFNGTSTSMLMWLSPERLFRSGFNRVLSVMAPSIDKLAPDVIGGGLLARGGLFLAETLAYKYVVVPGVQRALGGGGNHGKGGYGRDDAAQRKTQ